MTRSWKSQIADEVRATSMMNPKWPDDAMKAVAALRAEIDALTSRATAAEAALAAAMAGAVRVKPLEWRGMKCETDSRYSISYWDVEKLYVDSYTTMRRHTTLEEAKAAAQSDYARRILAALEPNPAAQDREQALIAATLEDIAQRADGAAEQYESHGNAHAALALRLKAAGVRSLATQPQTDALAARDAKMRERSDD